MQLRQCCTRPSAQRADVQRLTSGTSQSAQIQRCFAVRPGRDALLDVARATFNDNYDDISNLIQKYRDEFGIGSLKIAFSASRGYHVSAKCDADALPPIFIQVRISCVRGIRIFESTGCLTSMLHLTVTSCRFTRREKPCTRRQRTWPVCHSSAQTPSKKSIS